MVSLTASKGGVNRDATVSDQASALCGAGACGTIWLRGIEGDVRRACAVVRRGAGSIPVIEVLTYLDPRDDTPSAVLWASVRYIADGLAARHEVQITPIRFADAILFRIIAPPAAERPEGFGHGGGWLRTWLRR